MLVTIDAQSNSHPAYEVEWPDKWRLPMNGEKVYAKNCAYTVLSVVFDLDIGVNQITLTVRYDD